MSTENELPVDPTETPPQTSPFPALEEMAALLPQYEFHSVIGTGGMGAVYLARQAALDRWEAIKVLPASASLDQEEAGRFISEARAMAKLNHAHIAAVHDFGQTTQGHLYLVMEYVNGQDLHALIHSGVLTPDLIRALVFQLCDALQYAHHHGVIHRDIKPANILIAENWQAKIVDFGLAGGWNINPSEGSAYGTPDYVAPERLTPEALVDHRADIYALGVVIHEMFTRVTPLASGGVSGTGIPAEFVAVINRCMEADPARRFQHCGEIKSFLSAAAIKPSATTSAATPKRALPPHLQARVGPRSASRPVKTSGGAGKWLWATACIFLLMAGGWFIQNQKTKSSASGGASASADKASAAGGDKPVETPANADASPAGPFKPAAGEFSILKRLKGHKESVLASAILPDQRRAVSGGNDDTLMIWDLASGNALQTFPSPVGDVDGIIPSKDGSLLLLWSVRTDQVSIFDLASGASKALIRAPTNTLNNVVWSADQKTAYLLCADTDGGVYHWDPQEGAVLKKFSEWPRAAFHAFPLPAEPSGGEAQMLILGSTLKPNPAAAAPNTSPMLIAKPSAGLFSVPGHSLVGTPVYNNHRNKLSMCPDGTALLGGLGTLYILDLPDLTTRTTIPAQNQVAALSSTWLAGGRMIAAGLSTGHLRIYEADTGTELQSLDIGLRATKISVDAESQWLVVSGVSIDPKTPKAGDYDVLVVRLPDLQKLGSTEGALRYAKRQLNRLDAIDPELAAIRKEARPADGIATDAELRTRVIDLTTKYGAALGRAAATAPTGQDVAMKVEAAAIANGMAVPPASNDAATSGEHKRLREIYRQQMAQLETKRQETAASMREKLNAPAAALADKRRQAGDIPGATRCEALLASFDEVKPFEGVVASSFSGTAPSTVAAAPATPTPVVAATSAPLRTTPPPQALVMPPTATTASVSTAPKIPFAKGVRTEVTVSRPSKTTNFDDKTQIITPKVKLTNTTVETYEGYKAVLCILGESVEQRGVYKILTRHEIAVSLAPRQVLDSEGKTVMTEFDNFAANGVSFGFKYDGWVIQVTDPQNAVAYTKSTSPTLEKLVEVIPSLKEGQTYDKRWKPFDYRSF